MDAATPCSHCAEPIQLNERMCPTCGADSGPPNVKLARAQRPHLLERARMAREDGDKRGITDKLRALDALLEGGRAAINVSVGFLDRLLSAGTPLYATYQSQVRAGVRRPATPGNDQDRAAVEARLYGTGGGEVVYAALSADGRGLQSYGSVTLLLRPIAIERRATVLEENSYDFFRRRGLGVLDAPPPGHLGAWTDRADVAVAKLGGRIDASTRTADLPDLVLASAGDRGTDEFIEVHVWGPFGRNAIGEIRVGRPKDDEERFFLDKSRATAARLGIGWNEP